MGSIKDVIDNLEEVDVDFAEQIILKAKEIKA